MTLILEVALVIFEAVLALKKVAMIGANSQNDCLMSSIVQGWSEQNLSR